MKYILIISLVVNVALAVAYVKNSPSAAVEAHQAKAAAEDKPTAAAPIPEEKVAVVTTTNNLVQKFDWQTVESDDYRKYIANLRAIGCPEETIRDIIIADVNKLFESRRKEFKPKKEFKYWQTGMQMFAGMMDEEKIKKQQELAREKRALLKELLGIEPEEKMDMAAMFGANPFEEMLSFLSPSKQTQIMELEQKYAAKQMKAFQNGAPDAEDMKEVAKMQKEKDAELAQLLTPQEKEDYELRMSQTAMMMRMQLGSFDPNEQEFRDIFKLKKQYDDEFGGAFGMMGQDKAEREKMSAAQKELNDKIKGVLGENRYADYERAQDFAFQGIYRVTERQGLPKDSAIKIYDMKKAADKAKTEVRSDSSLSKEDRDLRLKQIDAETDAAMKAVWGDKGAEAYKKSRNGFMGFNPN